MNQAMADKGQAKVLTPDQLNDLWAELDQPHRLITQLCYYTGSRVGEIVALKAEDIQGDRIVIHQSKTDRTKTVDIAPPLQVALDAVELPKSGYLFPAAAWAKAKRKVYRIDRAVVSPAPRVNSKTGALVVPKNQFDVVAELPPSPHISTHAVNLAISRVTDLLGWKGVSSHSMRRSLATHMYEAGYPLRVIMAITGHQSLSSLTHYLALEERAAGNALREFFSGDRC